MSKEIIAFLAKSYNREQSAVASLLNDDGSVKENTIETLTAWDVERIKAIREKDGNTFDAGYGKGKREVWTSVEKKLKEKFSVDTDLTGDELIEEIHSTLASKTPSDKELTDDEIKKHPAFLKAEKVWKSELKTAKEESENKIKQFTEAQTKEKLFAEVAEEAMTLTLSKKPILPADQAKAKRRLMTDVVEPLKAYDWQKINGEWVALNKDGTRVEDDHGHPRKFNDIVLQTAGEYLEFSELEDRRSPITGQQPPAKNTPAFVPKNETEYQDYLKKPATTDEERVAKAQVVKDWNSKK